MTNTRSRSRRTKAKNGVGPFYFYIDMDWYANRMASDLEDFCRILEDIDVRSIEFHLDRGDFSTWIASLGDNKIATEIEKIKERGHVGEELRMEIHGVVKDRLSKPKGNRPKKPKSRK